MLYPLKHVTIIAEWLIINLIILLFFIFTIIIIPSFQYSKVHIN